MDTNQTQHEINEGAKAQELEDLKAENKQLKWKIEGLTAIIQNTEGGKIVLKGPE